MLNQAHHVRTVGGASPSDSDLSGSFWMGYSDANEIYIYAEVTDDQVEISPADRGQGDTWQDDSIEFVWGNYDVRDAGGPVTVDLDAAFAKSDAAWTVHHYVVDGGPTVNTPDDIILSYSHSDDHVDLRPLVTNPDIVTATLSGSKLTIALTNKARGGDASDIWIYAVDSDHEYARLRIGVNVSSQTGPYVVNALDDVVIREDDATDTKVYLFGAFGDGSGDALTYEVTINDDSKVQVGDSAPFVFITSYMRTEINVTNVGPNSDGEITIRPRTTGSVTFTVKASAGGESVEDVFTLTIVSRNAPKVKTQIPDQELDADGGSMTIDMADVDPKKEGEQPAFEAPDNSALTYTAFSKDASVVRAAIRGGTLTLTPIWGPGGHTYVTVSATNAGGETWPQTFKVTVKGATLPIVNPQVAPILATGIMMNTGDEAAVWDLKAIPNPLNPEESLGALFIDANHLPNGAYVYRLVAADKTITRTMVLLK